jgi:hypothetical protein
MCLRSIVKDYRTPNIVVNSLGGGEQNRKKAAGENEKSRGTKTGNSAIAAGSPVA